MYPTDLAHQDLLDLREGNGTKEREREREREGREVGGKGMGRQVGSKGRGSERWEKRERNIKRNGHRRDLILHNIVSMHPCVL